MIRFILALGLAGLAIACAHKDAGKGLIRFPGRNHSEAAMPAGESMQPNPDSSFYVGYVDYFPDTQEFYTSLFFREGHEYPDEDLLESKLDSVVVLEDDWGRERLPMEEAKKMLVLEGLDSIQVYNRRNELVCECRLARVEYLWNGLENYFIAVFSSGGRPFEQTEELYGVSARFSQLLSPMFSAEEVTDKYLDDFLIKRLEFSRSREWKARHYNVHPPGATYSLLSSISESGESSSYLACVENGEVRVLNEEQDNFQFLNILPLPVQVNGRPLLLISAGYPSSDVIWDYLAGFDGTGYYPVDYNRVPLKDISPLWPTMLTLAGN